MHPTAWCRIVSGEAPASKVLETGLAYAFLTDEPASDYHTLVVPKRHVVDLFDATEEDVLGVAAAVKQVVDLYRDRLGLENVEIASNSGAGAQQGVFHWHVHIVPRAPGDAADVAGVAGRVAAAASRRRPVGGGGVEGR